jgi:hypothetical protein
MPKRRGKFLEILTALLICWIAATAINAWIAPTQVVQASVSPNDSYRVEVVVRGFWGRSSVNLVKLPIGWQKQEVYSEGGDEVKFPKDTQVIWSQDSSRFFLISKSISSIAANLRDDPLIYLTSESKYSEDWQKKFPRLMLMYDIKPKKLWHNLYPSTKRNQLHQFNRKDLRGISWGNYEVF